MTRLHNPLIFVLATLFAFLSIWGSVDYVASEPYAAPQHMLADNSASPILKKDEKNQRRMEKHSRKKNRKPASSMAVIYQDQLDRHVS